jgi:hypothetical protein
MVGGEAGDRAVDRLGRAIVIQHVERPLCRACEELAARDAQPLGGLVDAVDGLVRDEIAVFTLRSMTGSYRSAIRRTALSMMQVASIWLLALRHDAHDGEPGLDSEVRAPEIREGASVEREVEVAAGAPILVCVDGSSVGKPDLVHPHEALGEVFAEQCDQRAPLRVIELHEVTALR